MELETWPLSPNFFTMSDSFLQENDALTTALLTSLSDSSTCGSPMQTHYSVSKPEPVFQIKPASNGRITKRKSRASKKSPTTYINADPANFKRMVQHVTGVSTQFGAEAVRPYDHAGLLRQDAVGAEYGFWPTLDTSSGLLGRAVMTAKVGAGSGLEVGGSGSGCMDTGFNFPTLESWGAM